MAYAKRQAVYAREFKKYGIRYAYTPHDSQVLAGVVQVSDTHGRGYVYIHYEEALIEAVGKAMPAGISEMSPCYLKVIHTSIRNTWRVFAFYVGSPVGVLLWEAVEKPTWLKRVRREKNGTHSQTKDITNA